MSGPDPACKKHQNLHVCKAALLPVAPPLQQQQKNFSRKAIHCPIMTDSEMDFNPQGYKQAKRLSHAGHMTRKLYAGSLGQYLKPFAHVAMQPVHAEYPAELLVEMEDADVVRDEEEDAPDSDHLHLHGLLTRLQRLSPNFEDRSPTSEDGLLPASDGEEGRVSEGDGDPLLAPEECQGAPCPLHIATGHGLGGPPRPRRGRGLLSAEVESEDLLSLLRYERGPPADAGAETPLARSDATWWEGTGRRPSALDPGVRGGDAPSANDKADLSSLPTYKEVPGPCEPEDLLDGVIFGAKYLGSTQLVSERNPPTHVRMAQAQKAVDRIKAPEGESQPMTEVDLFISTQRIKVLTADSQEAMMDHLLQTISYIADIGNIVVLMARRKLPRRADASAEKQLYKMICHVFHSADAPLIAQAIGQAFSVAYQQFLRASGIDPDQLHPRRCGDDEGDESFVPGEELYNGDLAHFSKQENCKEVIIHKQKGEILGIVIVESGWGSILPTVVVANLMHKGAAERSGKLSIGDRIMSANGTSLVGLPLASCQGIIQDLKSQTVVTLSVVHCPPVTTAIVRRPDAKYPLGFCVENGIICSLMRGGIAERGGIRVGHRIIEINGQSVVAMPHEKIIQILTQAVSEVHIKTMPASTYRLLTGQEQPVFL
ncbi:amyloid beta A4 precursor protein-binding family A member 3 [Podarcis lilfordi]|uniref:Amyloid-beta A4 precursor protein-binding family A member 3 n=1 Tax=Podarcis lilfordi TaxID=74358 RepID=A0AA35LMU9_9SAUR|nr:amyloid beta A4 precursor protein-binding family A member 3 [Podarcis lilfordi]